jgi:uncharacterized protein YjbI with pentapeptide repeats
MHIAPPHAPRLDGELAPWDETVVGEVEIDHALVDGADFAGATRLIADGSRLDAVKLLGSALDKMELTDVVGIRLEAAALQTYKANLLRVSLSDCRLTGVEFAEARFEDCVLRNLKLDEAGFRFAHFKRVRFENCVLRQADFSGATFDHVTFTGCDLEGANFASANCQRMDMTTEDLTQVKGLIGLKGTTISTVQLMQLAPILAVELGFRVED